MKRHLIILFVLCLTAMTLRAQDTTEVRKDVRIRQNCACGCHQHPVNDYEGLNSLRQRLANPSWDGKAELFRSIGTGTKIEDGKIVPLSKKSESSDMVSPAAASITSAQGSVSHLKPYLQQLERGEVPIGAPVFIFFRLAGTYVTDFPQLLSAAGARGAPPVALKWVPAAAGKWVPPVARNRVPCKEPVVLSDKLHNIVPNQDETMLWQTTKLQCSNSRECFSCWTPAGR